ncbi:MAG: MBL fold metallo-hydrolase [Chlorobia bacterium]|nr:MBL fold metallo-hydrolase [Fimbriimonadaceae bacterium]
MFFQRYYADSIAQASFLIGCSVTGEAVVVDPNRDLGQYLATAETEGLRIAAVTETHIHADYVSGSRELAELTGATLYLSKEGGSDWQYAYANEPNVRLIGNGDEVVIGNVRLQAIHTPGHTPEHLSFLVIDGAATNQPIGILSGDFIFAGDVGRPDLLEIAAGFQDTMRKSAITLFKSIERFKTMPDWLTIWPGHGAGSACGKKLGGVPSTTLGYEKIVNFSVRFERESDFVEDVLSGQPEPPKYFARMKTVNRQGPEPTLGRWSIEQTTPCGQIVDVRSIEEFIEGSLLRAVSIPMNASFSKWAGSLLSLDKPIVLVANNSQQAVEAAKALVLIGLENLSGWCLPEPAKKFPLANVNELLGKTLLDVRSGAEREEEAIPGSIHIPLVYLADAKNLPTGPIYVHCASGSRSLVGASYLRSQGVDAVAVQASFEEIQNAMRVAI